MILSDLLADLEKSKIQFSKGVLEVLEEVKTFFSDISEEDLLDLGKTLHEGERRVEITARTLGISQALLVAESEAARAQRKLKEISLRYPMSSGRGRPL